MKTDMRLLTGAAFFQRGFDCASGLERTANARELSGSGFIEMIMEMVEHVPFMIECVDVELNNGKEYTGVFDYEVSEDFGAWWVYHTVEQGAFPTKAEAELWLKAKVVGFFEQ